MKLLWKPEVVDAPIRLEILPQPATSISHLGPQAHVKKKRSPSSWRSKQRLKNLLEKKSCQERHKSMPLLLLEKVRNFWQLQLVHPNRWHLFSLNPVMTERMRTGAQRMQVLKEAKSCISQVTLSMKKMTASLVRYCKHRTILCI